MTSNRTNTSYSIIQWHNNTIIIKMKERERTSTERETGNATVRDSANAGESKSMKIEATAIVPAAKLNTHLLIPLLNSINFWGFEEFLLLILLQFREIEDEEEQRT